MAVVLCVAAFAPLAFAADDPAASSALAPVATNGEPASSTQSLEIGGVKVQLDFLDTALRSGTDPIVAWVERSIETVAAYYGRFPQAQLRIRISLSDGGGVRGGTAYGTADARSRRFVEASGCRAQRYFGPPA